MLKVTKFFTLRPKALRLLKNITFQERSRRTNLPTFPRDFKRLWREMRPYRMGFKPFDFYYPFLSLLPDPFPTYGSYFRLQSRTFIFWYEFAARKYNITFDFGIKQKKTASETAVWLRTTRRGAASFHTWWSYWRRLSSFHPASIKFFSLNVNAYQPFFSMDKSIGLHWFEESLPQARRWAWNFYSRLSTIRSGLSFLSQSIFESRLLSRRAPSDSTTFWLASPIHDYSAFIKSYTVNRSMILPERFFQFRRERDYLSQYWSQSFYHLWSSFKQKPSLVLNFSRPQLTFYAKIRLALKLLAISTAAVSFWHFTPNKVLSFALSHGRSANAHWFSRILPVPLRKKRSRLKFRTISFFMRRSFFLRHLRRPLFNRPRTLSFSLTLSGRIRRLNRLMARLFQMFSFNSVQYYHIFYLWFAILNHEWLASNLSGRYLALRPTHRPFQKKHWRRSKRSFRKTQRRKS